MDKGLTPAEDEQLRRLNALAEFGQLTPDQSEVLRELRARDRRDFVREPRVLAVPVPAEAPDDAGAEPWALA